MPSEIPLRPASSPLTPLPSSTTSVGPSQLAHTELATSSALPPTHPPPTSDGSYAASGNPYLSSLSLGSSVFATPRVRPSVQAASHPLPEPAAAPPPPAVIAADASFADQLDHAYLRYQAALDAIADK